MRTRCVAAAAVACALAVAAAECPNGCSGHGTCGRNDACTCYENYMGGDCSLRLCPQGYAWADSPRGDLNHDGSVTTATYVLTQASNVKQPEGFPTDPSRFSVAQQEAHFYEECSGKGLCNRADGTCACFDGFTGSACQRAKCPNDCSGHGVCRTVGDIATTAATRREVGAEGNTITYSGVTEPFEYRMWDAEMNRACVCDVGFSGPDCSLRECRRGDDPLTKARRTCAGETCRNQKQSLLFRGAEAVANAHTAVGVYVQLNVTGADGGYYATEPWPVRLGSAAAGTPGKVHAEPVGVMNFVRTALLALPHDVVEEIVVTCTDEGLGTACTDTAQGTDMRITVEFVRPTGRLESMALTLTDYDAGGASLYNLNSYVVLEAVAEDERGNKERAVCSNRGSCNYGTGLCSCFGGYTLADCSRQDSLAAAKAATEARAEARMKRNRARRRRR